MKHKRVVRIVDTRNYEVPIESDEFLPPELVKIEAEKLMDIAPENYMVDGTTDVSLLTYEKSETNDGVKTS